jgi:hypothetical protein
MIEKDKVKCNDCGWIGMYYDLLKAPNPFNTDDILIGCPNCTGVDCIMNLCDDPGCKEIATCGTPTESGYRRVCGKHWCKIKKIVAKV